MKRERSIGKRVIEKETSMLAIRSMTRRNAKIEAERQGKGVEDQRR